MVMAHAFLALLAGMATIAVLSLGMSALLRRLAPDWATQRGRPSPGATVVQLGSSLLTAAAGGYVTAVVAQANPLVHVLALGIAVLALAALSALQAKGTQPVIFQLAMVATTPLGVLAGGLLRLRTLGIL
jgi:hypothetical protein